MVGTARLMYSVMDRYDNEAREYTSFYRITDVARNEQPATILTSAGFPSLGTPYFSGKDYDYHALAVGYSNISPQSWDEGAHSVWLAQVKYSTDANKQRRPNENVDNPLNKPPMFSGGGHRRRLAAHDVRITDQAGNLLVNTAGGDFPDREVQVDDSTNVIRITKNYATLNLATLDDFSDSVNVGAWMGKPARSWKLDPPSWNYVYAAVPYYSVAYTFQGNPETWDLKPRNKGLRDVNGALAENNGVLTNDFEWLDNAGEFVFAGLNLHIKFDGNAPNPPAKRWYKERDFTALGLPASLPGS